VRYKTLLADPPWNETGGGRIKRGANRHYPLLKTEDIPRVILESGYWLPDENAHFYLWVTNTFLVCGDGVWVMKELGFRPVCLLTWCIIRFRYLHLERKLVSSWLWDRYPGLMSKLFPGVARAHPVGRKRMILDYMADMIMHGGALSRADELEELVKRSGRSDAA